MPRQIETMSDLSERVPYNVEGMKVCATRGRLSGFIDMTCAAHWHDDLEFNMPLNGRMAYNVNGERITVEQGQGMFVNARQLHNNFSIDGSDCENVCVVIHPSLLCASEHLAERYVRPIITNGAFTHLCLDPGSQWQRELIGAALAMECACAERDAALGMTLQSLTHRVAALLYRNMPDPAGAPAQVDQGLAQLRQMVGHVQRHYQEPMTLRQIAAAGSAGKSACCALFQRHLRQSPIAYLTRYRLEKGAELLKNPNLTVTEVALAVGFSGPSYFAESFRRHLGATPSEYRKRNAP